jgi:hypothetical protein
MYKSKTFWINIWQAKKKKTEEEEEEEDFIVDEEEDEVDEEEVTTIVRMDLKGLCRQIFDHEFFVKHLSPDPDIYISFI